MYGDAITAGYIVLDEESCAVCRVLSLLEISGFGLCGLDLSRVFCCSVFLGFGFVGLCLEPTVQLKDLKL